MPINPVYIDQLKAAQIDHPQFGKISVYDLVMKRIAQMSQPQPVFDPFQGPIKDRKGVLRVAARHASRPGCALDDGMGRARDRCHLAEGAVTAHGDVVPRQAAVMSEVKFGVAAANPAFIASRLGLPA